MQKRGAKCKNFIFLILKYIVLYHKEVACLLAVGDVSRELNMIPASDVLQYDYMVMTKF